MVPNFLAFEWTRMLSIVWKWLCYYEVLPAFDIGLHSILLTILQLQISLKSPLPNHLNSYEIDGEWCRQSFCTDRRFSTANCEYHSAGEPGHSFCFLSYSSLSDSLFFVLILYKLISNTLYHFSFIIKLICWKNITLQCLGFVRQSLFLSKDSECKGHFWIWKIISYSGTGI